MKTIDLFNNNHKPYATPRIRIVQMELTSLLDATGEADDVSTEEGGEWDGAKRGGKIIDDYSEEEAKGPFPYL